MQTRHLEDFHPGETIELGSRSVDRDEIIEFARKYDPQPFHVDEEAGRRSIYSGLIASGWHTVAMLMRLLVDTVASRSAIPSSGSRPRSSRSRKGRIRRPSRTCRRFGG